MVIDQMRRLGLSHLIGILRQEILHCPTIGPPRRFKWMPTLVDSESEDSSSGNREQPLQETIAVGTSWLPREIITQSSTTVPYIP